MKSNTKTQAIKELLDTSASQLTPATLEKLRIARSRAVDRQRTHGTVPVLSWLGHHGGRRDSFHLSRSLNWAVAALFAACLITGVSIWQNDTTEHEINEVDIAILTGDLPIHVYVD